MASVDRQQFVWNGRLSGNVDLLYYDKINVDVVEPPYSRRDRNSSFFLKTRLGYQAVEDIGRYFDALEGQTWEVTDVKIVYEDKCKQKNGRVYYLCKDVNGYEKKVIVKDIIDGCVVDGKIRTAGRHGTSFTNCKCSDDKLFTTNYVKGKRATALVSSEDGEGIERGYTGVQINKKQGGVMRGYFTDVNVEKGNALFNINKGNEDGFKVGHYIVVWSSENNDESGFCGQVRMITGIEGTRLTLNAPWKGFKIGGDEVRGGDLKYDIFSDWGEVVGFTSGSGIHIVIDGEFEKDERVMTMCDYAGASFGDSCIISNASGGDRLFFLYDTGYVTYGDVGYDKFYMTADNFMYAGEDKRSIVSYRDFLLSFGERNISVGVADERGKYYSMYSQSTTIGLKNKYAFGEYDGDMLIISNDNRLLALRIQGSSSRHMLSFEDVGGPINSKIKSMLPTDEAFIGVDNNELRIFINSRVHVDRGFRNTKTQILKFNTIFKVWTEDRLANIIIRGSYQGLYYGESAFGRKGYTDFAFYKGETDYDVIINAYLLENEDNGIVDGQGNKVDLFRVAKLNRLTTLLGYGRYDNNNTKIKIETYKNGFGIMTEIDSIETNDWIRNVTDAFNGRTLELSKCLLDDINDSNKSRKVSCENGHPVHYTIKQSPWCEFEKYFQYGEYDVCINDSIYKLAPTMPLVSNLSESQSLSSQIKLTLHSKGGDVISFGGWKAELELAPYGYVGADGEYKIEVQC